MDLMRAYKILFGLIGINARNYFSFANSGHDTRGHSYKSLTLFSRVDVRKYFFSQRIVLTLNCLAATAADLCNLRAIPSLTASSDFSNFV
jgi:hypothetical protein